MRICIADFEVMGEPKNMYKGTLSMRWRSQFKQLQGGASNMRIIAKN
jgi:hypothetical protein